MMKNKLFFDFSVNKETNTITVKRDFAATLPLVWDTWTIAELLDQWWAPSDWESKTKSMQFKEGGMRLYAMCGPAGEAHWGITTYSDIHMHKSFAGKDCFSDEHANVNEEYPQSDYRIAFMDKDNKTYIEHHTTYPDLEQLEASLQYGFKEGMVMAFEGLDKTLYKMSNLVTRHK